MWNKKKIVRFASPLITWEFPQKFQLSVTKSHYGSWCCFRQIMSAFLKFYMAFMEGVDVRLAWRRVMTKIPGKVVWHVLLPIEHRYSWDMQSKLNKVLKGGVCLFVCSIHRTQWILKPNLFQCFLASENLVPPLRYQSSLWPFLSLREPKLHQHLQLCQMSAENQL